MNTVILFSTLLLTLLLFVGLFFFIRASVKDRTQAVKFAFEPGEASLVEQLQQYLQQRSYKVVKVDAGQNLMTFAGVVRPSVFLAIFLTILAAVGIVCLALVWSLVFPEISNIFLGLVLLAPAAGVFYWKKSTRTEEVSLRLETTDHEKPDLVNQVTVIGHRDELFELQRSLQLKPCE